MPEQEYLGSVKPTREEIQSTLRNEALLDVGMQLGMVEVMKYQAIARAERERVLSILKEAYPPIDTWPCWQALKEEK